MCVCVVHTLKPENNVKYSSSGTTCFINLWDRISPWPEPCLVGQTCSQRASGILSSPLPQPQCWNYKCMTLGLVGFICFCFFTWIPGDQPLILMVAQKILYHLRYYPKCASFVVKFVFKLWLKDLR